MSRRHPDQSLLALGIRQPWAELILLGHKTIEVRRTSVRHRGPIYIYAAKQLASIPAATAAAEQWNLEVDQLPRGMVVGTVEIRDVREPELPEDEAAACVPASLLAGHLCWELAEPIRLSRPLKPKYLPSGIWFYPFRPRA